MMENDKNPLRTGYDDKGRFVSYWYQITKAYEFCNKSLLEIGIGTSFVSNYLRNIGLEVITIDIDIDLKPDIVAGIQNLPIRSFSFDIILCCQVLEHIPFRYFKPVITELYRISKKYIIISLPNRMHFFCLNLRLYPIFQKQFKLTLPSYILPKHRFDGEHYWEIGKKGYPLSKIKSIFRSQSLRLLQEFRNPEKPLHHFFLLQKECKKNEP